MDVQVVARQLGVPDQSLQRMAADLGVLAPVVVRQPDSSPSETPDTRAIRRVSETAARRWAKLPTVPRNITVPSRAQTAISSGEGRRGSSASAELTSVRIRESVVCS